MTDASSQYHGAHVYRSESRTEGPMDGRARLVVSLSVRFGDLLISPFGSLA